MGVVWIEWAIHERLAVGTQQQALDVVEVECFERRGLDAHADPSQVGNADRAAEQLERQSLRTGCVVVKVARCIDVRSRVGAQLQA